METSERWFDASVSKADWDGLRAEYDEHFWPALFEKRREDAVVWLRHRLARESKRGVRVELLSTLQTLLGVMDREEDALERPDPRR